jgi:hypothetical protein
MIAVVVVLFSVCCTLTTAMSVIFLGISVSFVMEMYLMLSAGVVLAILGAVFLSSLLAKWTQGSIAIDQDCAPSLGEQISTPTKVAHIF